MSASIYAELSWLAPVAEDFASKCRDLLQQEGDLGRNIRALANQRLDENQLVRLARAIDKARKAGRSLRPLQDFRLGLISNATTDFVVPPITASSARHGLALEIIRG